MPGIYIHIPFCKKICYYCDFFKSRDLDRKESFLKALQKELTERAGEGSDETFQTVYFGGGTPSVLSPGEVEELLEAVYKNYRISEEAEITFEANPEDVEVQYARELLKAGINRISIGCQSFLERDLQLMNRRHNAEGSLQAVLTAAEAGFRNISIDLIYGLPQLTQEEWENELERALALPVQHLSAYLLTFEKGTVFGKWLEKGKIHIPPEESIVEQYNALIRMTKGKGFVHYEISNFGKEGFFSRHNMLYWSREKYLGFGPSAHSYDLRERKWNVSDLKKYVRQKEWVAGREKLSDNDHFNDYLLTSLRTIRGADRQYMEKTFGPEMTGSFLRSVAGWIATGHITEDNGKYRLTDKGILVSDTIISDCMIT